MNAASPDPESTEQVRLALRRSGIIVACIERDLTYRWLYNPHPQFTEEGALGKRDDDLNSGDGIGQLMALKRRVFETREAIDETIEFKMEEGVRVYDVSATPVAGDSSIITTVAVDVTELNQRLRLQREFVAAVAHELRNPLTILRAQAQRMRRRARYDGSALDGIVAETRHMERMVNDLLDVAGAEAGTLGMWFEETDLNPVIRSEAERVGHLSSLHTVRLDLPTRASTGCWDTHRLEQVIQNLLVNAVKYSPDGGEIRVTVESDREEIRVSIADDGIGMLPEELDAVFTSFQRSAAAHRHGISGLGLGLAIAKRIVEAHGGRIYAASDGPGRGSTFTFTLPRSR